MTRVFGAYSKLTPMYIGPYSITESVWEITYWLQLPKQLVGIHKVHYMCQVCKYIPN